MIRLLSSVQYPVMARRYSSGNGNGNGSDSDSSNGSIRLLDPDEASLCGVRSQRSERAVNKKPE